MAERCFQQSIAIQADSAAVESCFSDLSRMHGWLNPLLRCHPVGDWSIELGSRTQFEIKVPLFLPHLDCFVCDRGPGLIVWQFEGYFHGTDTWRWQQIGETTQLDNAFCFTIPNPFIAWGFDWVAAKLTQKDMQTQLVRLKAIAESINNNS